MKTWTMIVFGFVLTLVRPAAAAVPDVSGSWAIMGELAGNQGGFFTATCTFQQKGDKLDGVCKRTSGDTNVTGQVTDQGVSFKYDINREGATLTFQFKGTVEKAGSEMKGRVDVENPADTALEGTFTATKQKK